MRRYLSVFRQTFQRLPVVSTPLIRNAFELGHCVSKPIKQCSISPPFKQNEYFFLGLAASLRPMPSTRVRVSTRLQATSTAAMIETQNVDTVTTEAPAELQERDNNTQVSLSDYWGSVRPNKLEAQPWTSSTPTDYSDATNADITRHRTPENFSDQFARLAVMALKGPTDLFFRKRYFCRAAMLETVAGVPGMVAGMILHCRSLRRYEHSGRWIKALLEEAENERMHLMTFMELSKPSWQERALTFALQAIFFNVYLVLYVLSPRFCHRMVGYLEEESIKSYTELLKEIDNGGIANVCAPELSIDYWRLPQDATLRDVIIAIRADQTHHRDVNHFAADIHLQGHKLKEAPITPVSSY